MTPISEDDAQGVLSPKASILRGKTQRNSAVGDRIRLARKDAGLIQAQIAEKTKVTRSAVSSWEKGLGISSAKLILFAQVVGVSPQWLVTGEDDPLPRVSAPFDPALLGSLIATALEVLPGRPSIQCQEISRAILAYSSMPPTDGLNESDPAAIRRFVEFLIHMYAP